MRPSLQAFMKKIKNKTVFIIGGGPSINNVDLKHLENETVVCINDAYKFVPTASVIYWMDESWASQHSDLINQHSAEFRFTSKYDHQISYEITPDPKTICNTYVLRRTGDTGFDINYDCVRGNNSGVQVLNLIINMKPERIILLGYDMKKTNGKTHFHNGERLYIGDHIYNDMFIPSINTMADELKKLDNKIEIINANPNSAINCFTFGNYTDYLTDK